MNLNLNEEELLLLLGEFLVQGKNIQPNRTYSLLRLISEECQEQIYFDFIQPYLINEPLIHRSLILLDCFLKAAKNKQMYIQDLIENSQYQLLISYLNIREFTNKELQSFIIQQLKLLSDDYNQIFQLQTLYFQMSSSKQEQGDQIFLKNLKIIQEIFNKIKEDTLFFYFQVQQKTLKFVQINQQQKLMKLIQMVNQLYQPKGMKLRLQIILAEIQSEITQSGIDFAFSKELQLYQMIINQQVPPKSKMKKVVDENFKQYYIKQQIQLCVKQITLCLHQCDEELKENYKQYALHQVLS